MLYKNHKHIGTVEQSYTKEVAKKSMVGFKGYHQMWFVCRIHVICSLRTERADRPNVLRLVRGAGSPNVPGDCPINYISQYLVARADPCDARNWVSLGICHPGVNQPTRAGWMIYDPDLSSIEHEHRVSKKRSTSTVAI